MRGGRAIARPRARALSTSDARDGVRDPSCTGSTRPGAVYRPVEDYSVGDAVGDASDDVARRIRARERVGRARDGV